MKRQMIRLLLAALVVGVTFVAAWGWTAKYDGNPDPKTRFVITEAMVSSDRSYRWVELHLKKSGTAGHDHRKPVWLITADGTEHRAADFTYAGSPEEGFTDMWFKFWLEESDLNSPLTLRINDGVLRVKTDSGAPALGSDGKAVFKSTNWGKSWLGF